MHVPTGIFDQSTVINLVLKVMSVKKNMTAADIRQAVVKEGADGVIADRVVDGMIRTRTYFDRSNGRGNGVTYSLKRFVAKAYNENIEALTGEPKPTIIMKEAVAGVLRQVAATSAAELIMRPTNKIEPVTPKPVIEVLDLENDTVEVAIWKVMADGKTYSVADLEVLLADAKMFSVRGISPKMTQLRRAGKIVRAVGTNDTPQAALIYELIPGAPMPAQGPRGAMVPHKKTFKGRGPVLEDPTLPASVVATKSTSVTIPKETYPEKKEAKAMAPTKPKPTVPAVKPAAEVPLLEITVRVKGVVYSIFELKQIVDVFTTTYDVFDVKHDVASKLVETNYTIGGNTFTIPDARALVQQYREMFE